MLWTMPWAATCRLRPFSLTGLVFHVYFTANLSTMIPYHRSANFYGHEHKILYICGLRDTLWDSLDELVNWVSWERCQVRMGQCTGSQVRQAMLTAMNIKLYASTCGLRGELGLARHSFEGEELEMGKGDFLSSLILWNIQINLAEIVSWFCVTRSAKSKPVSGLSCLLRLKSITDSYSPEWTLLLQLKNLLYQSWAVDQAYVKQVLTELLNHLMPLKYTHFIQFFIHT